MCVNTKLEQTCASYIPACAVGKMKKYQFKKSLTLRQVSVWLSCIVFSLFAEFKLAFLHKSFTLLVVVAVIKDDKISSRVETRSVCN